jgi:CheY-like chemotaxis protein
MSTKILWADDEIDLLKPHILFLQQKGYEVDTVNNGSEAVEEADNTTYDVIFLDENMPGISGLDALLQIKTKQPHIPIVMITKSEEEYIMEEAIGSKIADYLIKPVNPNQILLTLKKILDQRKLVSQKTTFNYQQKFRELGFRISNHLDKDDWIKLYTDLVFWELELSKTKEESMNDILLMQKNEANQLFCEYIEDNYLDWLNGKEDAPEMIHTVFKNRIAPLISKEHKTFLVVIDNLRFDQWKVLEPILGEFFKIESEDVIYSILPSATQYARNSLFAGLMPSEIQKRFPKLWVGEDEEGGKNLHEEELLEGQLKRLGKDVKWSYHKITNLEAAKKYNDNFNHVKNNNFAVLVYNFVDALSHAKSEMDMIKELADDEAAYRSLTESWFKHSPLYEIFEKIKIQGFKVILTTDHGTIRVKNPVKIVGERSTNSNLRYKTGRNLSYNSKEAFSIKNPADAFLPKSSINSEFVFTRSENFFVYQNNYNQYVRLYQNSFQHGGISMEELLIPFVILSSK